MGSIFAAIMPGVRHARTPLVAGYAWLLALWLFVGRDGLYPSTESEWAAERRIALVADALPLAGRVVLISAVAYLIGTLVPAPRWPRFLRPVSIARKLRGRQVSGIDDGFSGWVMHVWTTNILAQVPRTAVDRALVDYCELVSEEVDASRDTRFKVLFESPNLPRALFRRIDPLFEAEAGASDGYPNPEVEDVRAEELSEWRLEKTRIRRIARRLFPWAFGPVYLEELEEEEVDKTEEEIEAEEIEEEMIARDPTYGDDDPEMAAYDASLDAYQVSRLIRWSFHDEYEGLVAALSERQAIDFDRLDAEADFRLHLWLPLLLAIVLAAVDSTVWVFLLLAAPAALLIDGVRSRRQSRLKVVTALTHGLINSPTVEFFRNLPADKTTDRAERYWAARERARQVALSLKWRASRVVIKARRRRIRRRSQRPSRAPWSDRPSRSTRRTSPRAECNDGAV